MKPAIAIPTATQSERDHIPILPPSPTRLLARIGPLSGQRLGLEALIALLLGIPALLWGLRSESDADPGREPVSAERRPQSTHTVGARQAPDHTASEEPRPSAEPRASEVAPPDPTQSRARVRRAAAGGLLLWMLTGIVLFSHMARLHPRYVEGFTPVVAAMLGIGVAWATAGA